MAFCTTACYEFDLTGDLQIPAAQIVQRADALMHMKATIDSSDNVLDLTTVDEIKVESRPRYTSIGYPIFSATLVNAKVVVVDAVNGLFDVQLSPEDTDFAGTAIVQVLYHTQDGRTLIGPICEVVYLPTYLTSDIVNPEDPEVLNYALYNCPLAVEVGDLVYQTTTADTVDQALASDPARVDIIGWVVEKPTTTTCKVTNDVGPVPSAGLNTGNKLYLSPSTPGKVTNVLPTSPNARLEVGVAKDVDEYIFTGSHEVP